jgi:predicted dehydrogenase
VARKSSANKVETVGVGVIGAGGIARGAHIPGYKKLSNVKIVAVSDPVQAAREGVAQEFDIEYSYDDFHEMLKRDDIQAISVTTPNFLHAEATIAALQAGKHVLCEKPLAMNAQEGEAMVRAAKKANRKLMCGYNMRFLAAVAVPQALCRCGRIRRYLLRACSGAASSRHSRLGHVYQQREKRRRPAHRHRRALTRCDAACARLSQAGLGTGQTYQKFGKRKDVLGLMGQWDYKNFTVEDFAAAFVRFENGTTMVLESSFVANIEGWDNNGFQLFGDKGGATLSPLKMFTEQNKTLLDITPVHLPSNVQTHHEEMKSFIDSIINDTPVMTPGEEALQVTRIIDAIYESGETGREVML